MHGVGPDSRKSRTTRLRVQCASYDRLLSDVRCGDSFERRRRAFIILAELVKKSYQPIYETKSAQPTTLSLVRGGDVRVGRTSYER